jgi:alpha-L-fucosidase
MVYDIERGKADGILPLPWQTDTCIGSWHYDRTFSRTTTTSPPPSVIRMLADIVSKNGNLMLSVPLQRDGQPDADEIKIVSEIGAWLKVNGEAIYATRPWKIYGEGPIPYATMQVISNGDSDAVIAEKAAKVLPRANQTDWMRLERTFFLHFGVNTFNGVEWGSGREEPSLFNPTELDANQWLDAMQNFGGKMIVLVCKHHDGFCYWPTRYTPHSVAASPWRDGKGDEVREVADAARAHGLKLAVYLSPADLYQLRTNPKNPGGYYGDGSSNVSRSFPPIRPASRAIPQGPRAGAGFTNYTYVVDDYNRYFLNQLYELLTEYGPIEEVWFDGANPDPSVHETYNYAAWYDLIRHLQPGAVIMGKGPDVRWVGNEGGVGRTTEWSVIPLPTSPDAFNWPDMREAISAAAPSSRPVRISGGIRRK